MDSTFQDSPTIGRTQLLYEANSPLANPSAAAAGLRPRPAPPSPLSMEASSAAVPRIVTTGAAEDRPSENTYYNSASSGTSTPEQTTREPEPSKSVSSTNETTNGENPLKATQSSVPPSSHQTSSAMAGPASERAEPVRNPPRNSSIDSSISTISTRSGLTKAAVDAAGPEDIAHLIKTAGSAEAVIQYLLKEKQSQSQQNAQLWRLVDKQRAMILGLNKDLERALKDKEKYRKKLKEVLEASGAPLVPAGSAPNAPPGIDSKQPEPAASTSPKERILEVPLSPTSVEPEAPKHSPVDMALAPYPITPPANQPAPPVEPQASVAEVLDPSHSMPKASEFALNNYDPDAQEREAEAASKRAEEAKDIPVNLAIPPSRTAPRDPREPPRNPPPQVPAGLPNRSPKPEDPTAAFPPPPAPPPRKPPPAPLHLHNAKPKPNDVRGDSPESDTDYDAILEVPEEKRGRRRTREEDDRERAILAAKEAELRSLSKKSKKSSSRKASEKVDAVPTDVPASPRLAQATMSSAIPREPASLAGVLSGAQDQRSLAPAIMSPGLPASPRPMGLRSPPLSPMGVGFPAVPLSPRPPRGPIPLPPNTPLHTPSPGEPAALKSPRPQQIRQEEAFNAPSPTKSTMDSPVERTKIYRGFVTEEYPDLLLPPNALPSIDIKVASSRMKPSRASLISLTQLEEDPVFTLAVYSRADGGELWRIEKDTASLAKLDQRLKQCPNFTAKTPDRSLFSGHAPAKLDARRNALNQYLDELLNTPLDNATALELCKYLSTNTLPPNADETGSSTDSNSESQRTGPGGRPYRSGYLTKRGKNFGGWKARYFVLDGPMLKYYETPGGAHLGTIKLKGAQIGKQAHHNNDGSAQGSTDDGGDNQYRHAFLILEPKKKDPNSVTKHVLCAESDKERDQWVDALLRWIDYRDPEDEESPKKEHASDRTQERGNGKKKQGKQQQQRDEENLIGVSYETTRQGDIPQGVPTRGKSGDHESTHSMSTTSSFTISAPRDPQIISNTEAWGSKLGMGLAPPTQEEKKARKRSFFGFGPKPRTSSDGQESLFGSDSSTLAGLQQQLQQQYGSSGGGGGGSNRQAFGASLAEAVRYNPPSDVRVPLPAVVYRCIQYLDAKNAIFEEGIFRLSGSNVVIKQLRERFNNEGDINLLEDGQFYDIHAIASLLKLYLRELPSTILTNELRGHFIAVTEMTDHKEKMKALAELVERLPQANAALLKYLIAFLIKIIDHSDVNKMTVRNVGIVFSPTLNIPAPVFAMFLQNYEAIFGIHPSEYELPVVEPDLQPPPPRQERRPSLPSAFQERRPSDARPSTSHGDSPHRQRLMEALEAGNRSTPTPPPMTMQQMAQMNAANMHARSTPTPPPQRPLHPSASEPSLGMGPGLVQQTSMRPAYEGNYAMPPAGYENLQVQMNKPVAPAYDRPLYENGLTPAPYDSTYRSRRESAMFMGTLSQQGSKSRLREEAQF